MSRFLQGEPMDSITWLEKKRSKSDLIIKPGYAIRMVDGLVTNFHQPGSTLLCLVAAATGMAAWKSMYAKALAEGYRFLSYGDGCLLWCNKA